MADSPTAIRAVRQADHRAEGLARRPHDADHGGHLVVHVGAEPADLGFGRIVASAIEAPDPTANLG